jgi:hypothetical protein
MVRVEAPPATVTPPRARDRTATWLTLAIVVLLIDAFLPWERWCGTGAFDDEVRRCFSARLWSGSASILGSLALVLLIAYVISTVRVGARTPVGGVRQAVLVSALAALVAKLLIGSQNDQTTSEAQAFVGSASVGMLIGALLTVACISLLAVAMWSSSRRLRSIAVPTVLVLTIFAGAILYARSGLAWWGGPLAEPAFLGGGNGSGHVVDAGEPHLFAHLLFVQNHGTLPVRLDSLEMVDATPHFLASETYVFESPPCSQAALDISFPEAPSGTCIYRLRGHRVEPSDGTRSVLLGFEYEVSQPGVYRSGWFRIRYHTGPLLFEVFRTDQLVVCVPDPGKKRCPGDGF